MGPDYIVGPGDAFQIRIWGREETALDAEINVDGDFILPRFGRLPVSGMTFDEMKKALNQTISRQVSEFQMSVVPVRQRRCRIFVLGEVQAPGSFDLEGNVTAHGGLFAAGGPTTQGSLRAIKVKRENKDLATIDLYDFLLSGNRASDVPLRDGDVLFVPLVGTRVGIRGGVRRPATFELFRPNRPLAGFSSMRVELPPLPTCDTYRFTGWWPMPAGSSSRPISELRTRIFGGSTLRLSTLTPSASFRSVHGCSSS